jgi:uncharacterized protein YcaQ
MNPPQQAAVISTRQARRLALVRAGLLKPEWTGMPRSASDSGRRARKAALAVVSRFGYLQLDTVAIAGARSHAIVLLSRINGFDPTLGEALLAPGEPLFEYWGHEASWLPLDLYPTFEFRRQQFKHHPWWGDVLGQHPVEADKLLRRIRDEGPLRSLDMEGQGGVGWDIKLSKRIASAFWSRGDLAIRERRNFQRTFDLAERVIPQELRDRPQDFPAALKTLLMRALAGLGWAQTGTLTATWRLRNLRSEVTSALQELVEDNQIEPCDLATHEGKRYPGWIRPTDLELIPKLDRLRPRRDRGVLLSPFDPVLWDRPRVQRLFGFDQVLEIFKPRPQRTYGYYCLPVLAGDRLIGRVDLKADRKSKRLQVLAELYEKNPIPATDRSAVENALIRFAKSVGLSVRR